MRGFRTKCRQHSQAKFPNKHQNHQHQLVCFIIYNHRNNNLIKITKGHFTLPFTTLWSNLWGYYLQIHYTTLSQGTTEHLIQLFLFTINLSWFQLPQHRQSSYGSEDPLKAIVVVDVQMPVTTSLVVFQPPGPGNSSTQSCKTRLATKEATRTTRRILWNPKTHTLTGTKSHPTLLALSQPEKRTLLQACCEGFRNHFIQITQDQLFSLFLG